MDTVTPEVRSRIMSRIRGKNTKPELRLRGAMAGGGVSGFECHADDLPGKPDFAFRSTRTAVFVEGCFWHGCPVHYKAPKSNVSFWATKVKRNMQRDGENETKLRLMGWSVYRFWECQVKHSGKLAVAVSMVKRATGYAR
jgi:DNA mismatch endonuclease (patch repair protein)